MSARPTAPAAILAAWVAFSLTPAQAQMTRGEITLEKAREILGTDPVAIPGYAVRFYALSHAILVHQELDSGRVIRLLEDRSAPTIGSTRRAWVSASDSSIIDDGAQRVLAGYPSNFESRYWARQSSRKVGDVNVRYLGWSNERIPYELLDRLAPIQ